MNVFTQHPTINIYFNEFMCVLVTKESTNSYYTRISIEFSFSCHNIRLFIFICYVYAVVVSVVVVTINYCTKCASVRYWFFSANRTYRRANWMRSELYILIRSTQQRKYKVVQLGTTCDLYSNCILFPPLGISQNYE